MGSAGFRELCSACRKGLEEGEEGLYEPPLELLEVMAGVFPEQIARHQGQLATIFHAAQVRMFLFCLKHAFTQEGTYIHIR